MIGAAVGGDGGGLGAFGFKAEDIVGPASNEPANIRGDGVDVFDVFLDGIGVVEAQVALAGVFAGDAEIETDGLGVTDVKVAVGLGRKARDDLWIAFFGDVAGDDVADEITRGRRSGGHVGLSGHSGPNCGAVRRESTPQLRARA